tara:strand:+ start:49 stop:615 length:567 start_codon:yes stop_codon:yes gene_type:complete
MGSNTKTPTGGDKKQTPGEQVLNNFLQFTNTRPRTKSEGMTLVSPDGTTAGFNYGFDQTMSDLLAGARSRRGKNVGPPSRTIPSLPNTPPPSQTMPPVFIPPQAPPSELFKDSVLNTLETVQLPPSERDESISLPGIDLGERFRGPQAFTPPPPTTPSGRNLLPFLLPLPVGLGSLFREFLLNQQEDD